MNFWNQLLAWFGCGKAQAKVALDPIKNIIAPMLCGIHLRPWDDSATAKSMIPALSPQIVRIWFPAFGLFANMASSEQDRLIGLIFERIVAAREAGYKVLIVTSASTLGSGQKDANVEKDAASIARYYATFAKIYPGMAWEFGNEVELDGVTAKTYAKAFDLFVTTMRIADGTAKFVTAGVSGFNGIFIAGIARLITVAYDAIGIHPYGTAPKLYAKSIADLKLNKKVWFTEFGIQAGSNVFAQSDMLLDYYAYARGLTDVAIWYALQDMSNKADPKSITQTFGVISYLDETRPSFTQAQTVYSASKKLGVPNGW